MTITPPKFSLLALALGALLAPGAGLTQTESTTGEGTTSETAAEQVAGGFTIRSPLAIVDGVPMELGELVALRRELPDQYQAMPDEVLYEALVDQMIDQMLLAEAGRKQGLQDRPAIAYNLLNQQRAILADAYLRTEIAKRATPEATEALYQERYADAPNPMEVRAAHILVESEEMAADLKAQLDGGADFAELAQEHGTDGSAPRGGDLGWFIETDMVPEFGNAAFAMEPGTVSDPVKTDFGWHVIKLEEKRERATPELEDVQDELLGELIQQAQQDILAEVRANAEIVKPEPALPAQAIRSDQMLDEAE